MLAEEVDGIVVSSDGIRAEWYGSEEVQGDASKIFREVEQRCKNALCAGQSVIMDATNMNAKKRTNFLKQMPECKRVCVVMATPFDVCVKRDEERSRHVDPAVLEKMRKNFQMPYYNEGWDHIEVFYPKDCEMVSAEYHFKMEAEFNQCNKHHTLTVGDHEEKAAVHANENGYGYTVAWAASFHDCGKIWCQTFKEGDPDAHYYNHESVGAYQFLTTDAAKAMYEMGNTRMVIEVAALITWHMVCYQFKHGGVPKDNFKVWAVGHGFDERFTEMLWQLHECDVAAH